MSEQQHEEIHPHDIVMVEGAPHAIGEPTPPEVVEATEPLEPEQP
jgi:hypothetical protein